MPTFTGVTFRQFCDRVRRVKPLAGYRATRDELYVEWRKMLTYDSHPNYLKAAQRIETRRAKVECLRCAEPWSKENKPFTCPECGSSGCEMCIKHTENGTCCCPTE